MQGAAKSLRILIIEDNHDVAEMLRTLLDLHGHTVMVAYSGKTGIEGARQFHPDLVLCDISLPDMDGYTVATELQRDAATATARLIALSGFDPAADPHRPPDAKFDLHLTKPIDPEALLRVL
jgi:CheY-like chemotaxis protein